MITPLSTHRSPSNIDEMLDTLLPVLDRSQIAPALEEWADERRPWQGRAYSARGVLATMWLLSYRGTTVSLKAVLTVILGEYQPRHLTRLGLDRVATPERKAKVQGRRRQTVKEYMGLRRYLEWLFAPIDDTPFPPRALVTFEEAKRLQAAAVWKFAEAHERRHKVMNDLIVATIDRSIFVDLPVHFAVDEHVIHTAKTEAVNSKIARAKRAGMEPVVPTKIADSKGKKKGFPYHAGIPMATWYPKQRRTGDGWHIGLTRLLANETPDGVTHCTIAFAMSVHGATAGTPSHMLRCVRLAKERGMIGTAGRKTRKTVTSDNAYSNSTTANFLLLQEGFNFVMRYGKGINTTIDLAANTGANHIPANVVKRRRGQGGFPSGPYLHLGQILCPAAARLTLEPRLSYPDPLTSKVSDISAYQQQQATLDACAMPYNGPTISTDTRPGNPGKGGAKGPECVKFRVRCPASAGRVRCPAAPATMTDAQLASKPLVDGEHAVDVDYEVCSGRWTTITLSPQEFKQWQPHRADTPSHAVRMRRIRATDEGYNSSLTNPAIGDLNDRSVHTQSNPFVSLIVAFAVATTNLEVQRSYLTKRTAEAA